MHLSLRKMVGAAIREGFRLGARQFFHQASLWTLGTLFAVTARGNSKETQESKARSSTEQDTLEIRSDTDLKKATRQGTSKLTNQKSRITVPALLALPTELRLQIYQYLAQQRCRKRLNFTAMRRMEESALDAPHNWIFTHPLIFNEALQFITRIQTAVLLKDVNDVAALRLLFPNLRQVVLDFPDVSAKQMQQALRCLKDLPGLYSIIIKTSPWNLNGVRFPYAWRGFPALTDVILVDDKLKAERKRKRHEAELRRAPILEDIAQKKRVWEAMKSRHARGLPTPALGVAFDALDQAKSKSTELNSALNDDLHRIQQSWRSNLLTKQIAIIDNDLAKRCGMCECRKCLACFEVTVKHPIVLDWMHRRTLSEEDVLRWVRQKGLI
ncbi:Hypothetical predicted protein [Lecanosticta acicola]|uniref:Uncharacterized protein n=1 Tax=Lecanosticta acicola TaxID=111012 RepID=A0AAI8Z977_9PEZI|nr:Hypothetical predicted protein [Lecanosticta acicola]